MLDEADDPYALLGVAPTATTAQVRRAYRRMIVVSHRRRVWRLVEHLEALRRAYDTLIDPVRRRQHDAAQREARARSCAASLAEIEPAPDSSDRRRRETSIRAQMARELDAQSRRQGARALAANAESVVRLAREHEEREAAHARRRVRRELWQSVWRAAVWMVLLVGAALAARLVVGPR